MCNYAVAVSRLDAYLTGYTSSSAMAERPRDAYCSTVILK